MSEIYSITEFTINHLIEKIDSGELGLPELQRPFIWSDSKVRDLFDSMMRGYPIGYLMLWESPALDKKKHIGVETHSYGTPRDVIIDGQQRLTSLYAVMKGKKVVNSKYEEKSIIISYNPIKNKFDVGDQAKKRDPEWIYNISELYISGDSYSFTSQFFERLQEGRAKKVEEITPEERKTIPNNISAVLNLKDRKLSVFDIKSSAEEEDVSEIFVRVNSGGIALKQNDFILTLLSLYWDEGRQQIERFCKESTMPPQSGVTSFNYITDILPQDIVRVFIAYAFDRARLKYGYKLLRGADFDKKGAVDEGLREDRFDRLKSKLPDILNVNNWHEFLKTIMNAGYMSKDMILSGNTIFFSYALYLIAKDRFNAKPNDNLHLISLWFYFTSLVSTYSGAFESEFENQLNAIKELNTIEEFKHFILSRVNDKLTNDYFNITLVGSDGLAKSGSGNNAWFAYVAALNILNRRILFSKTNLLVSKLFEVGTDGKRKSLEKHHLFPKAYLSTNGYSDTKINQMANYAYIDWKDNMDILDDAPSKYYPIICQGRTQEDILQMEQENALPHGWENMTYEDFLEQRRKLMAEIIQQGFEVLKKNVESLSK